MSSISDGKLSNAILSLFHERKNAQWTAREVRRHVLGARAKSGLRLEMKQTNRVLYSLRNGGKLSLYKDEGAPVFSLPGRGPKDRMNVSSEESSSSYSSSSSSRRLASLNPPSATKKYVYCDMGTMANHLAELRAIRDRHGDRAVTVLYATPTVANNLGLGADEGGVRITTSQHKGAASAAIAIDAGAKVQELSAEGKSASLVVVGLNNWLAVVVEELRPFCDHITCCTSILDLNHIVLGKK